MIQTFAGGHRVDDGLDAGELAFVDVVDGLLHSGEGADGGELSLNGFKRRKMVRALRECPHHRIEVWGTLVLWWFGQMWATRPT